MPNGHLGSRGAQPGKLLLAFVPTIEDVYLALGTPTVYYRFEEPSGTAVADFTGNYPGTYNGTVSAYSVTGPSNGAVSLASGAYVNGTNGPINTTLGQAVTISFWVKFAAFPTSGQQLLFGFVDSSTVWDKILYIDNTGKITAGFTWGGVTRTNQTTSALTLNYWHHVCLTLGSGGFAGFNLYLDGANQSSNFNQTNSAPPVLTNTTGLYVGNAASSPASSTFAASVALKMDEVIMWSGVQASAAQVQTLYTASQGYISIATNVRMTNESVEAVRGGNPHARLTQDVVEVAHTGAATKARLTQLVYEVVRQSANAHIQAVSQTLTFTPTVSYVHVAGGTTYNRTINDSLTFTQTVSGNTGTHWYPESVTQTLGFTQTATGVNVGKSFSQTLSFTQTVVAHMVRPRSVLQALTFTDTAGIHAAISNQHISQVLAFNDRGSVVHTASILQSLTFSQIAAQAKAFNITDTLNFTQTVATPPGPKLVNIVDTLVLTQKVSNSIPAHLRQTLNYTESINTGFIFAETCDRGTLGDTGLGNFELGADCGVDGTARSIVDTLTLTQSVTLGRIFHRTIVDSLEFEETLTPGPFVRSIHIIDHLDFEEGDSPRPISIGNGQSYIYQQPPVVATIARPMVIMQSAKSAIVLPSPIFDDSESLNGKVQLLKVMSARTYSYIKSTQRLTLKYTFLIGRKKALEMRQFYIVNSDEYITLTNWKGQIFVGKLSMNPIDIKTTRRWDVTGSIEGGEVEIEFQGVRVHG